MMQIPLYRIKDWDKNFEINRSRQLKRLWWVATPNKHDGDGYTDLITRPDGISLFGTWCLIVQVASKVPQPERGTLVKTDGKPRSGTLFGLFLILVFGMRFLIEFIKEDQVGFESGMSLNMGQWLSIPFVLAGMGLLVWSRRRTL